MREGFSPAPRKTSNEGGRRGHTVGSILVDDTVYRDDVANVDEPDGLGAKDLRPRRVQIMKDKHSNELAKSTFKLLTKRPSLVESSVSGMTLWM